VYFGGIPGQNIYPNPDNFPISSFPQPVPAPDGEPDDAGTLITVQYSWHWQPVLLGAVDQLLNPYTWQGNHDEILNAIDRAVLLKTILQIDVGDVQAPFWDEESGDDADDLATVADQTWYGSWDGETFTETLAYVFLTNFLSTLVSPAAAVKFLTIPRAFRVAIKQNPHGAKLLLFLDGGLYAVVNGYSIVDQVVEVIVKALPSGAFRAEDDSPLELLIVNSGEHDPDATPDENGNYTVGVLRSRLQASDVTPANIRYNPDTDTVQMSPDGGTTWNDATGSDPRRAPAFRLPARTGVDRRCDAAANMVAWIHNFMDEVIADLTGIGTAGLVLSTALNAWSLLFEPTAIIELIATSAEFIGGLGSTVLGAAFDSTAYDQMLCIFFCASDVDGQISPDGFLSVQSQIAAQLNTTAAIVMALILGAQGEVGLSNAGAIGTETGDCSACTDCGWCFRFDATHDLSTWTSLPWNSCPGDSPSVYTGTVWQNGTVTIDGCSGHNLTYIHLRIVLGATTFISDGAAHRNGTPPANATIWANGDGSLFSGTEIWNGSWLAGAGLDVDSLEILFFTVDSLDSFDIDWIQFSGTDDNPFGENNC
jgi:hypothetical protein